LVRRLDGVTVTTQIGGGLNAALEVARKEVVTVTTQIGGGLNRFLASLCLASQFRGFGQKNATLNTVSHKDFLLVFEEKFVCTWRSAETSG
jgi:hypothetical protein